MSRFGPRPIRVFARFMEKCVHESTSGCWTTHVNFRGSGTTGVDRESDHGEMMPAHRVAWELSPAPGRCSASTLNLAERRR